MEFPTCTWQNNNNHNTKIKAIKAGETRAGDHTCHSTQWLSRRWTQQPLFLELDSYSAYAQPCTQNETGFLLYRGKKT